LGLFPFVKLNPRNFRSHGRATALFASLTLTRFQHFDFGISFLAGSYGNAAVAWHHARAFLPPGKTLNSP
jgi:hypothetical protein